ncbi:hypothetical protein ES705_47677 [subsurface metagenome]
MSEIKIKPLADRVLVEPQAAEEKTASALLFPILQRKNLKKVLLLQQDLAQKMKKWK